VSGDSHLQQEFDKAFPFTETVDQVAAIADLKQDMEQPKPMDRLICGDVGFGKTEVAMRAVFKAVDAGDRSQCWFRRQSLPNSISARSASGWPSSRCCRDALPFSFPGGTETHHWKLKEGAVDVVIGTHRLVSKDIKFKDLGLLVIDEEQKFGVKVKERLKHIRAEVDV
jgi:transcription-repair coupling factor (superfamily II helicase)